MIFPWSLVHIEDSCASTDHIFPLKTRDAASTPVEAVSAWVFEDY